MSDYRQVSDALKKGVDPENLCMTCPWDRLCITPPTMTSAEVDTRIKESARHDEERAEATGKKGAFPAGMLLSTLVYAGKDVMSELCPVLTLRLRSTEGRGLSDKLKNIMKEIV